MDTRALARKNLERKLAPLRAPDLHRRPHRGWIRAIRDGLGMSTRQAAALMGIAQSTFTRFEKSEAEDTISLGTLRRVAAALDCKLVYALVPDQPLEEIVQRRARVVADARLGRVAHTMRLEDQSVGPDEIASASQQVVDELLRSDLRRLWDDA